MKHSIKLWSFWGFAVTSLVGTLLHFLYEWTGNSILVAPFSAVNESIFEHMKLLFFPLLFFALVQSRFFQDQKNFWCIKLKTVLLGIFLIPALYYLYNGAIGKSPDFVNIAIFFITAAIVFFAEAKLLEGRASAKVSPTVSLIALATLAVLFIIFTFFPLTLPLFQDPTTRAYGIPM